MVAQRNLLDVSRMSKLGWMCNIDLGVWLDVTYQWYLAEINTGVRAS